MLPNNLAGNVYNGLQALYRIDNPNNNNALWICRCSVCNAIGRYQAPTLKESRAMCIHCRQGRKIPDKIQKAIGNLLAGHPITKTQFLELCQMYKLAISPNALKSLERFSNFYAVPIPTKKKKDDAFKQWEFVPYFYNEEQKGKLEAKELRVLGQKVITAALGGVAKTRPILPQ